METLSLLQKAGEFSIDKSTEKPTPEQVVESLLTLETNTRKNKQQYSLSQLWGSWRLCFITGTKKTREKAGIVLGSGKYVPKFLKISLSYLPKSSFTSETVENCVQFGLLKLKLSGPIKFLEPKNILVFDFTRLAITILNKQIYSGYIRNGQVKEAEFLNQSVAKQQFFVYFLVTDTLLAARGREGGLALWVKADMI